MRRVPGGTRGFALIVTLWMMVGTSAVVLSSAGVARDALGTSRNRSNATRANWIAAGCLERVRHALYEKLWPDGATPELTSRVWAELDNYLMPHALGGGCYVSLTPAGLGANINSLGAPALRRLLLEMRVDEARVDSLVDALMDWRDGDDSPRPYGAERDWYENRGSPMPRNGPIADVAELQFIRGFGELSATLRRALAVDDERVLWPRASRAVLITLPGITEEVLNALESHRRTQITQLERLGDFPEVSHEARDSLMRNAALLRQCTTAVPEAWTIRATAAAGMPAVSVESVISVILGNRQLITVRRVTRP